MTPMSLRAGARQACRAEQPWRSSAVMLSSDPGSMEPCAANQLRQACSPAAPPPQQRQADSALSTDGPSRIWLPEIVQLFARSFEPQEAPQLALTRAHRCSPGKQHGAAGAAAGSGLPVGHNAAEWGSEEQLAWLAAQGAQWRAVARRMGAAYHGDLALFRSLGHVDCPWNPAIETSSVAVVMSLDEGFLGHVACTLCWLLEQGCQSDWGKARVRARENKELNKWLLEQRQQ
ncbi:hypothetical protein TSOC_005111 [Tetrabaena socialis]|uniref:Uncharacterized protein n=1 Tax=Tetrabaena socialis TaxID=47790 RepID=A0A2J8A759_9CHLO|nr:hypothetical protein TSOC_005111 [Tetrabaena socialis]|eukprot:PNH08376.1 hypothetical protein TSOC_005111 [Tetrabaena socialis]